MHTDPFAQTTEAGFADILREAGVALAVSAYEQGAVIVVSASPGGGLNLLPRRFAKPQGLAADGDRLAVAGRTDVVVLANAPALAAGYPRQPGRYDGLYVPRSVHFCGEIDLHDLAWDGAGRLVGAATRFSCLCVLDDRHSFTPLWAPPFVSALTDEDRCHLNGFAMAEGVVRYATAAGIGDGPLSWRDGRVGGGVVLSVPDGAVVLGGLSMPHSPRIVDGRLLLLNSGTGELLVADPVAGTADAALRLPGFPRGLVRHGRWLFVGLSRLRESRAFRGLALEQRGEPLICGLAAIDAETLTLAGLLSFGGGWQEIYDVAVLPGGRNPGLLGLGDDIHRTALALPGAGVWSRPMESDGGGRG